MDEICQICGMRKATIVVKTNVNGVKSEQHLCPYCAAKLSEGENFVQDFFNEAAMLADRVGIVLDGNLRAILPAAQLFAAECDEDVAAFLGRERNSLVGE